jgi:hypothetical protein
VQRRCQAADRVRSRLQVDISREQRSDNRRSRYGHPFVRQRSGARAFDEHKIVFADDMYDRRIRHRQAYRGKAHAVITHLMLRRDESLKEDRAACSLLHKRTILCTG